MTFNPVSAMGNTLGQIHELPLPRVSDVSLNEHADIACVLISAAVDAAEVLPIAEDCLSIALPPTPGAVVHQGGKTGIWLSPRSWLLFCEPADEQAICERVLAAFPDRTLHASAFTDYLCWFSLSGPRSEDLIRQGSTISLSKAGLPVGSAKRIPVNEIPIVLYRKDEQTWLLGVERSRAVFFRQWLESLDLL